MLPLPNLLNGFALKYLAHSDKNIGVKYNEKGIEKGLL
jgi:hypothetical protein